MALGPGTQPHSQGFVFDHQGQVPSFSWAALHRTWPLDSRHRKAEEDVNSFERDVRCVLTHCQARVVG